MADNDKSDTKDVYGVKKKANYFSREELEQLDKKDLVDNVLRLQAHNSHLRNIILKRKIDTDDEDIEPTLPEEKKKEKRAFDFSKCRKRHILLKFMYLGWDYLGLVTQEDTGETIEEYLFNALVKSCLIPDRQTCNFNRSGRTDKGVSASCQVVSLDVRSKLNEKDGDDDNELPYCKMLNRILPHDIRVISWCPAPENYSARFNCVSRTYRYYFIKGKLNVKAMTEAASYLIGQHDFRNLCKMDVANGVVAFIRNIQLATINKFSSSAINKDDFDVYVFEITSTGFLWHQIRCIMSVLLLVGENKEKPTVVKELLDVNKHPRKPQYGLAHFIPLVFHDCQYDFELKWRFDVDEMKSVILQLHEKWTIHQIKASQILDSICNVKNFGGFAELPDVLSSGLLHGPHPKPYKPLLERPLCESLESRIEHFVKRQRIEKKESKLKIIDNKPLE